MQTLCVRAEKPGCCSHADWCAGGERACLPHIPCQVCVCELAASRLSTPAHKLLHFILPLIISLSPTQPGFFFHVTIRGHSTNSLPGPGM